MGKSPTDAGDNLAMGRRVKEARERIGLSQRRLADMIAISQSCISLWENGVNGASVACFFQLADALQVDARWLATGIGGHPRTTNLGKPGMGIAQA
jgi:transcriptional regulator with XRE-family HTH domain